MSALVIAEHDNQSLKDATLATVSAALKLSQSVDVLVAGQNCAAIGQAAAQVAGVRRVLVADAPAYAHALAENVAPLIVSLAKNYTAVLAPATATGKNILPRAAALLDVAQLSDVSAVVSADTFERPIYGGQAIATVCAKDALKVLTIRPTAFAKAAPSGGSAAVETLEAASATALSQFVRAEITKSDRPELTAAKVIVSGGRAMGSADAFKQVIEPLADKLGAAIGASRAAVDAGYMPNDYQVGQTGKVVAPELYIAAGISGAIQHLAGMKDSKIIVAINKDEDAPIFQVADLGLVADLFQAVPEMTGKV
jgi:electron transfer flavoprotein alpha subunit